MKKCPPEQAEDPYFALKSGVQGLVGPSVFTRKPFPFQGMESVLVEVTSTTFADIIKEYSLEKKNTNKNTNK